MRVPQYPLPHSKQATVEEEVQEMLRLEVIEPALSPYNAPVVLVKKKDGTRFCVDFHQLNNNTDFDAEPMPDVEEIFAKTSKAVYFRKFDLCKGFLQINICEKDRPKTDLPMAQGQFQFKRMPFGLKNATAAFIKMMRKLLQPLGGKDVHNLVDDMLVVSSTFEQHLEAIDLVLIASGNDGLKAKP